MTKIDPDGKKFDRGRRTFTDLLVSRCIAKNTELNLDIVLDFNTDLLVLKEDDSFNFILSKEDLRKESDASLLDKADYAMHGKVYKLETLPHEMAALFVSFGGLLLRIAAPSRYFSQIQIGAMLFLYLKKH